MEGIIKLEMDKDQTGYSAGYQTPQTQELDTWMGLTGKPVEPYLFVGKFTPPNGYRFEQQRLSMNYLAFVAANVGNFVGLSLDEIVEVTKGKVFEHYFYDSVREGWLEEIEYEGVKFISPTTKVITFDREK